MMKLLSRIMLSGIFGLLMGSGVYGDECEIVQKGFFKGYEETNIGDLLKARFDNCKWARIKNSTYKLVIFQGEINKSTHDLAMQSRDRTLLSLLLTKDTSVKSLFGEWQNAYNHGVDASDDILFASNALDAAASKLYNPKARVDHYLKGNEFTDFNYLDKFCKDSIEGYKSMMEDKKPLLSKRVLLDSISKEEKKMELNKEYRADAELKQSLDREIRGHEQKIRTLKLKIIDETMDKLYWPVGEKVTLLWLISPDNKNIELVKVGSKAFEDFSLPFDVIVSVICSKVK